MSKKRTESSHFKAFRRHVPDFPSGEVWHEDSPDFWIHTPDHVLGIEHCLVHIPTKQKTPLQAIESQTDEIISVAQEHAELRGTPAIQATFLFRNFYTLKKKQRIELARDIARTVHDAVSKIDSGEPFSRMVIRQPELPAQLASIQVTTLKEGSKHFWRCARVGWAVKDCKELLQNAIDQKATLFEKYMQNCSECWLLMVAEVKPSSFIHPNQDTIGHGYRSPFERTFFMDLAQERLYELRTVSG